MTNAHIYCVANQKGGVSKSTTVHNLAYALAELGKRVLAVDFDSQSNLTVCFGIDKPNEIKVNIAHLMTLTMNEQELPDKSEYILTIGKVDLIPCSIFLSVVEANLSNEMGSEKILSTILEPLRKDYDAIILDTGPSLGSLTINALTAADSVIVTLNPQLLAVMGLQDLTKTIFKIRKHLNDRLEFAGILLTICDMRTNLHKQIIELVDEAYKDRVKIFNAQIPRSVKVAEANYHGKSVIEYAPSSPAAIAYQAFAKELIEND